MEHFVDESITDDKIHFFMRNVETIVVLVIGASLIITTFNHTARKVVELTFPFCALNTFFGIGLN